MTTGDTRPKRLAGGMLDAWTADPSRRVRARGRVGMRGSLRGSRRDQEVGVAAPHNSTRAYVYTRSADRGPIARAGPGGAARRRERGDEDVDRRRGQRGKIQMRPRGL